MYPSRRQQNYPRHTEEALSCCYYCCCWCCYQTTFCCCITVIVYMYVCRGLGVYYYCLSLSFTVAIVIVVVVVVVLLFIVFYCTLLWRACRGSSSPSKSSVGRRGGGEGEEGLHRRRAEYSGVPHPTLPHSLTHSLTHRSTRHPLPPSTTI